MKRVLPGAVALTLVAGLCSVAAAQSDDVFKERRDKKLAEAWVKKAPWILDYDKAKAESAKAGKPIFAYFTRSYAP